MIQCNHCGVYKAEEEFIKEIYQSIENSENRVWMKVKTNSRAFGLQRVLSDNAQAARANHSQACAAQFPITCGFSLFTYPLSRVRNSPIAREFFIYSCIMSKLEIYSGKDYIFLLFG
jgi:hypothetical protein